MQYDVYEIVCFKKKFLEKISGIKTIMEIGKSALPCDIWISNTIREKDEFEKSRSEWLRVIYNNFSNEIREMKSKMEEITKYCASRIVVQRYLYIIYITLFPVVLRSWNIRIQPYPTDFTIQTFKSIVRL